MNENYQHPQMPKDCEKGILKVDKNNTEYIDLKLSLFNNGVHYEDIKQGNLGNCYLLASISALTNSILLISFFFAKS